jgi:hypothetical protein
MTYSVYDIKIDRTYSGEVIAATISGAYTCDLSTSNNFALNLSGGVTFSFSNAKKSTYNFVINAGANTFNLATSAGFKTPDGANLGLTGSFVMSGIYDGTDMFIAVSENYISL